MNIFKCYTSLIFLRNNGAFGIWLFFFGIK